MAGSATIMPIPTFAQEGGRSGRGLKANVEDSVILMVATGIGNTTPVDPETGLNEFGCGPASDSMRSPRRAARTPAITASCA